MSLGDSHRKPRPIARDLRPYRFAEGQYVKRRQNAAVRYRAPMPRAILFDLYNTLVPGGSDTMRHETARLMGADLGIDPDTYAHLYQRTYPERFVGAFGDLEATVRTLAAMAGGSPTPSGVRLAATRRITMIRSLLWPSAGTLATLDALRANGWRLGLVSNCTAETPELWKRTPLAGRFDAVSFSCELGVAKPDPAIYLAACSFLDVSAADCLYVGDGADRELAGAASLGMTAVQTVEFVRAEGSWPRHRIGTLADLPGLLTGLPVESPRNGAPW
jgi:putative hydrolase of the HAD superfamily